jgi:hypothetical protein
MTNSTPTTPLAAAAFVGGALTGGAGWLAIFTFAPALGQWTIELALGYAIASTVAALVVAVVPRFERAWRAGALGMFVANVATVVTVYELLSHMTIEL